MDGYRVLLVEDAKLRGMGMSAFYEGHSFKLDIAVVHLCNVLDYQYSTSMGRWAGVLGFRITGTVWYRTWGGCPKLEKSVGSRSRRRWRRGMRQAGAVVASTNKVSSRLYFLEVPV